jgi:hypothetical protein
MNKVDSLVRDTMLRYMLPGSNRFTAFSQMMTHGCFGWNANGELEWIADDLPVTAEQVLAEYRIRVDIIQQKQRAGNNSRHIANLYAIRFVEARQDARAVEMIVANLDVFASTWCGVKAEQIEHWLWHTHRFGIHPYWPVNNKPEVIDEKWRLAILEWLNKLIPIVNSVMGVWCGDEKPPRWEALPGYAEVFDWVKDTHALYTAGGRALSAPADCELVGRGLGEA